MLRFDASIPDLERRRLASLMGRRLCAVRTDRCAVDIATDTFAVGVVPEELATPDDDHPHADVTRPRTVDSVDLQQFETIASELGSVTSVAILSTVVLFSPPQMGRPVSIGGVEIPEGIEYGPVFWHPSRRPHMNPGQAVVDLDIAFELQTDANNRLTIYTDGCGFFVYASVNAEPIARDVYERTSLLME